MVFFFLGGGLGGIEFRFSRTEMRLSSGCGHVHSIQPVRHPCSSVYLYCCDDSFSNSKDASLNKGLDDQHRIIDLFINDDINFHIVICPNVSSEKSDLGTDAGGGSQS